MLLFLRMPYESTNCTNAYCVCGSQRGGAVSLWRATVTIRNSLFRENYAPRVSPCAACMLHRIPIVVIQIFNTIFMYVVGRSD
jgi:hypothetical protein